MKAKADWAEDAAYEIFGLWVEAGRPGVPGWGVVSIAEIIRKLAGTPQNGFRLALEKIRDLGKDSHCGCTCGDDPDCCLKIGATCDHCIAQTALQKAG